MRSLNVYLTFPGTCEAAMNFYKDCLDGEVSMQAFGEAPMDGVAEHERSKIMHAEFRAEGIYIMASDGTEQHPVSGGNMVNLSINMEGPDELDEQASIFSRLSEGGIVTMPLADTFWGARFGMLTDKFGINWMFNCMLTKS